ncbi:MAG: chromosome segregation protein SMC [Pseudomonadota bacterium]
MRVKQLEINGFKSFADLTTFQFDMPITAIVGPNGCGKSNVVDAIKWVLGEGSLKSLRGNSKEDIIFGGNDTSKSKNMAEVSIIFEQTGANNLRLFGDANELSVSRKMYRDGESQFFINKVPCRLKDIQNLFMDTGIGTSSYSIIEQENVNFLINAKPEERRCFIEEAAGITRFKQNRKEALNKLKATSFNLSRVEDILKEVEERRVILKEQSENAIAYKQDKDEIEQLDFEIASVNLFRWQEKIEKLRKDEEETATKLIDLVSQFAVLESNLEKIKLDKVEKDNEIETYKEVFHDKKEKLTGLDSKVDWLNSEIQQCITTLTEKERQIEKLEHLKVENSQKVSSFEYEAEKLCETIKAYSSDITVIRQDMNMASHRLNNYSENFNKVNTQFNDVVRKRNHDESNFTVITHKIDDSDKRKEEYSNRLMKIKEELSIHQGKKEEFDLLVKNLNEKITLCNNEKADTLDNVNKYKEELALVISNISSDQEELTKISEKISILQDFEKNLKGYDDSVKEALKSIGSKYDCNPIARLINVEDIYDEVIYAALEHKLQYLMINDKENIGNILNDLSNIEGRVGLVFNVQESHLEFAHFHLPGVIGRLSDLVEFSTDERISAIRNLLSEVIVVDNKDVAYDLMKRDKSFVYITLKGEVFDPCGFLVCGKTNEVNKSIFTYHREIEKLSSKREKYKKQLEQFNESKNIIQDDLFTLNSKIDNLNQQLSEHIEKKQAATNELFKFNEAIRMLNEKAEEIEINIINFEAYEIELGIDLEKLKATLISGYVDGTMFMQKIDQSNKQMEVVKNDKNTLQEKLNRLELDNAKKTEEQKTYVFKINELHESMNRIDEQQKEYKDDIDNLNIKKETKDIELRKIINSKNNVQKEIEDLRNKIVDIESEAAKISQSMEDNGVEKERLVEYRASMSEKRIKIQGDVEQTLVKSNLEGENIFNHYSREVKACEPSKEFTMKNAKDRINTLKEGLIEYGEVNLAAIEEFKQVEERFVFLSSQKEDLITSIDSLKAAIKNINRVSRIKFREAFDKINEQFNICFTEVFGGGEAYLKLEDDQDPLEAGVDVFVQPPGKKIGRVSLLSGGEKALSAFSLMMAVFKYKTVPFCFMDEVDAPLDEANIGKFCNIVKKLSKDIQVIMITHNKNTMSVSDTLFGITMERKGVSKLVTAKFKKNGISEAA